MAALPVFPTALDLPDANLLEEITGGRRDMVDLRNKWAERNRTSKLVLRITGKVKVLSPPDYESSRGVTMRVNSIEARFGEGIRSFEAKDENGDVYRVRQVDNKEDITVKVYKS